MRRMVTVSMAKDPERENEKDGSKVWIQVTDPEDIVTAIKTGIRMAPEAILVTADCFHELVKALSKRSEAEEA